MRENSYPFLLSDVMFKNLFRLTKDMVRTVVFPALLPHMFRDSPLAVDPKIRLFAALYFYATGSYQRTVGQSWNISISQAMVSLCVEEVSRLICDNLASTWIVFPNETHAINAIENKFMEKANFPGVLGAIDCTQEHSYLNRKGYHSKNIQIICCYDLKILNILPRFGSKQSKVRAELESRYNQGIRNNWLIGDSGYPQEPWLMTPLSNTVHGTPNFRYNEQHIAARNCIERCNGVLKARFRCFNGERKLRYAPAKVGRIVTACAVLHNICIEARLPAIQNNETIINEDVPIIINQNNNVAGIEAKQQLIERYFQ